MTTSPNLAGPWRAVLRGADGIIYAHLADVPTDMAVSVSVVRGSAIPGPRRRMPVSYASGDVLYSVDDLYVDEGADDPTCTADARWEQARAVAELLNGLANPHTNRLGARWPTGEVVAFDSDAAARRFFDSIGHDLNGPWAVRLVTTVHDGAGAPDYLTT